MSYDPWDPELAEFQRDRARRRRVLAAIAALVIAAMIALYVFSDLWGAVRRPLPPTTTVEYINA